MWPKFSSLALIGLFLISRPYLGSQHSPVIARTYRRIARRRGKLKALFAVAPAPPWSSPGTC